MAKRSWYNSKASRSERPSHSSERGRSKKSGPSGSGNRNAHVKSMSLEHGEGSADGRRRDLYKSNREQVEERGRDYDSRHHVHGSDRRYDSDVLTDHHRTREGHPPTGSMPPRPSGDFRRGAFGDRRSEGLQPSTQPFSHSDTGKGRHGSNQDAVEQVELSAQQPLSANSDIPALDRRGSTSRSGNQNSSSFKTPALPAGSNSRQSLSVSTTMLSSSGFKPVPQMSQLTPSDATRKREALEREESINVWQERIERLSASVNAQKKLEAIIAKTKELRSIMASSRYTHLPTVVQENFVKSLNSYEAQREEAQEQFNEILEEVKELQFWPLKHKTDDKSSTNAVGATPASAEGSMILEDQEYNKLTKTLAEYGDTIRRMDRTIKDVVLLVTAPPRSMSLASTPTITEPRAPLERTSMETSRPEKRKRITDDVEMTDEGTKPGAVAESSKAAPEGQETLDTADLMRILHRVTSISDRVAELENTSSIGQDDMHEMVEFSLEERFEHLRLELRSRVDTEYAEKMGQVKAELELAGTDVEELAGEIASMIERQAGIENRISQISAVSQSEKILSEMTLMRASLEEERASTALAQERLRAQVEQSKELDVIIKELHNSTLLQNQLPDELASIVESPSLDRVRGELIDLMTEFRANVAKVIKANTTPQRSELLQKVDAYLKKYPSLLSSSNARQPGQI